jgi:hypothetical protein
MTPTMDYLNNTCKTPHHENLKTTMSFLYGKETWNNFRLLENLRIKIVRRAADLDFLKKCRDNNLTPIFALISHQICSKWNYKAFEQLSRALVWGELRKTRAALDALSRNALKLHLQLTHKIHMDLWTVMDVSAALKAGGERRKAIEHHTRKLQNLTAKRDAARNRNNAADNRDKATANDDRKVVNLSNLDLNKEEIDILKKGLGFVIAPKIVPVKNIVAA